MPAVQQPSTPPAKPKGSGVPIGAKKTPKKSVPTSEDIEDSSKIQPEQPHTPVPGDGEDDDNIDADKLKPDANKLDEAIDLGDNEDQDPSEDLKTDAAETEQGTVEEPSEIGNPVEDVEQTGEKVGEEVEHTGEDTIEEPSEIGHPEEDLEQAGENVGDEVEHAGEGTVEEPSEIGNPEEDVEQTGEKLGEEAEQAGEGVEQTGEEVEQTGEKAGEDVEQTGEEAAEEVPTDALNFAILEGKTVNKGGFVVDDKGDPVGKIIEGDIKKLMGKKPDKDGNIWNDSGKIIGKAEPIPDDDREPASTAPFEDFPDAVVDASGKILFENRKVGVVTEGDPKTLAGKKVDADGDILDKYVKLRPPKRKGLTTYLDTETFSEKPSEKMTKSQSQRSRPSLKRLTAHLLLDFV